MGRDCRWMGFWRSPRRAWGPKVQSASSVNLSGKRTEIFSGLLGKAVWAVVVGSVPFRCAPVFYTLFWRRQKNQKENREETQ